MYFEVLLYIKSKKMIMYIHTCCMSYILYKNTYIHRLISPHDVHLVECLHCELWALICRIRGTAALSLKGLSGDNCCEELLSDMNPFSNTGEGFWSGLVSLTESSSNSSSSLSSNANCWNVWSTKACKVAILSSAASLELGWRTEKKNVL